MENSTVKNLQRDRRYRRVVLPGDIVVSLLSGEAVLHLPDGSVIESISPNTNLLPTGLTVFVLNEAFEPIAEDEEAAFLLPPQDYFFTFKTDAEEIE